MKYKLCEVDVVILPVDDAGDEKASEFAYKTVQNIAVEMTKKTGTVEVGRVTDENGIMDEFRIRKTPAGKPFFEKHQELKFSISHTEGMIAVAVCHCHEVGIDIEKIHDVSERIIERFYTDTEKEAVCYSDNLAYTKTLVWTAKEAHSKCIGTGLNVETLGWDTVVQDGFKLESVVCGEYLVTLCKKESGSEN